MPQSPNNPKDKSSELLIEQWKLTAEMADRVSSRRIETSKFYSSLLTGLIAVIPFALGLNISTDMQRLTLLSIGIMGLLLCYIWIVNIRSYKQLNSLKFKVIHEIEKGLPFPCFTREWEIGAKEKSSRSYLRLSVVEQYVPLLLMIPFLILLIFIFFV